MSLNTVQIKSTIKNHIFYSTIILLITLIFVFSFISYLAGRKGVRRTFIFPSAESGKYIIEYRTLSKNPHQGDIQFFIDEILLGSTVERTKLLFTPGTKLLSCFERDEILYLNLSSDLLFMGDGVIEIKEGIDLLERNIELNFPKINKTEIFIEGKSAFEK